MRSWHKTMDDRKNDVTVEGAYKQLVDYIVQVAEGTVGRRTFNQPKGFKSRQLQRLVKQRNAAGRAWRQANAINAPDTAVKLSRYKFLLHKTALAKRQEEMKSRKRWQAKVIRDGGLSSRRLWKTLKPDRESLNAVVGTDGETITDSSKIVEEVYKHFSELTAINTGEQTGQANGVEAEAVDQGDEGVTEVGSSPEVVQTVPKTNGMGNAQNKEAAQVREEESNGGVGSTETIPQDPPVPPPPPKPPDESINQYLGAEFSLGEIKCAVEEIKNNIHHPVRAQNILNEK